MFEQSILTWPLWLKVLLAFASLWELCWKGFGLWRASRNKEINWFIAILILNTIGILPIVYLTWFDKKKR